MNPTPCVLLFSLILLASSSSGFGVPAEDADQTAQQDPVTEIFKQAATEEVQVHERANANVRASGRKCQYSKKYTNRYPNCMNTGCHYHISGAADLENICSEDPLCSGYTLMMERGKPVGCTKRCGDEDSWNGYNSYNNQDWYIKNPGCHAAPPKYIKKMTNRFPNCMNTGCHYHISGAADLENICSKDPLCSGYTLMMERGKPAGCTKRCGDEDSWNGYNSYNNQDWYIKNPEGFCNMQLSGVCKGPEQAITWAGAGPEVKSCEMQLSGFCAGDPANDIGHTKSVTCTDGTQLTLTLTHTGANNAPTNRREVRVIGNDYEKSSGNLRDCACNAYSGKIKGTQYNPAFTSILYFDFHDYNSCTALDQPVGSSYRNQNRLAYSIARALPTPSPTETPTAAPTRDIHSGFCSAFTILRKGHKRHGGTFDNDQSLTEEACFEWCDQTDGCISASFETNGRWGQQCWLGKAGEAPTRPDGRAGCRSVTDCRNSCYLANKIVNTLQISDESECATASANVVLEDLETSGFTSDQQAQVESAMRAAAQAQCEVFARGGAPIVKPDLVDLDVPTCKDRCASIKLRHVGGEYKNPAQISFGDLYKPPILRVMTNVCSSMCNNFMLNCDLAAKNMVFEDMEASGFTSTQQAQIDTEMRAAAKAECESFKGGAPVKVTFKAKPTVPQCQDKCDAIKFRHVGGEYQNLAALSFGDKYKPPILRVMRNTCYAACDVL